MVDLILLTFELMQPLVKKYRYKHIKYLGSGISSSVHEYYDNHLETPVAIKTIDITSSAIPKSGYFEPEVLKILSQKHQYLLTYYTHYNNFNYLNIVMEKVEGTPLYDILEKGSLPEPEAKKIFYQIVEAMSVVHSFDIIHRDLKPDHIYICEKGVKIIDWGFSILLKKKRYTSSCGSPYYVAPEIVQNPPQVSTSNDVWSLGVILHEMLTCKRPIKVKKIHDLFEKLRNFDIHVDSTIPKQARSLLKKIFVPQEERLKCDDILHDPWFSDLYNEGNT